MKTQEKFTLCNPFGSRCSAHRGRKSPAESPTETALAPPPPSEQTGGKKTPCGDPSTRPCSLGEDTQLSLSISEPRREEGAQTF